MLQGDRGNDGYSVSSNRRDEEMRQLFGGAGVEFVGACDELDSPTNHKCRQ